MKPGTTPYSTGHNSTSVCLLSCSLKPVIKRPVPSYKHHTHMDGFMLPLKRTDESSQLTQPWLPAAVAPGRLDTVMSGGKWILGGSSTSASGPSAMLLKCHTVKPKLLLPQDTDPWFPLKTRETERSKNQTGDIKIKTNVTVSVTLSSLRYFLTECARADAFKGETSLLRTQSSLDSFSSVFKRS